MYSDHIIANFSKPTHGGEVDPSDIVLENKDPVCGDQVRITIAVDGGVVERARFRAWGCATSIATANILCKWLEGQSVRACAAASADQLAAELGRLSPEQRHCHQIAINLISQLPTGEQS